MLRRLFEVWTRLMGTMRSTPRECIPMQCREFLPAMVSPIPGLQTPSSSILAIPALYKASPTKQAPPPRHPCTSPTPSRLPAAMGFFGAAGTAYDGSVWVTAASSVGLGARGTG